MGQGITNVEAVSDPLQNKLLAFAVLKEGGVESRVPMGLVSDGTAKWLALIVAVLTNRSSLSIEEPENFLHPRLQQEIVRIVRSICEDPDGPDRVAIMTTHSETLLNALYAEEVVVTLMTDGITSCHRAANTNVLSEMINETGFGLGHYYVTGAIE
jgi:predicted ATPase